MHQLEGSEMLTLRLAVKAYADRWTDEPEAAVLYQKLVKATVVAISDELPYSAKASGKRGGMSRSEAKATAARSNGSKGGRPRKPKVLG